MSTANQAAQNKDRSTQPEAASEVLAHVRAAEIDSLPANDQAQVRRDLLRLRSLIITQAAQDPQIGQLVETVKWGQLSYLTRKPQSGTTIRLGTSKLAPESAALFVHCQTPLIAHFRSIFGETFRYESSRALICPSAAPLPEKELAECIRLALRYHIDKKRGLYADSPAG